jgi:tRNA A-37 threonylcarbamoyl transferase component Bud32
MSKSESVIAPAIGCEAVDSAGRGNVAESREHEIFERLFTEIEHVMQNAFKRWGLPFPPGKVVRWTKDGIKDMLRLFPSIEVIEEVARMTGSEGFTVNATVDGQACVVKRRYNQDLLYREAAFLLVGGRACPTMVPSFHGFVLDDEAENVGIVMEKVEGSQLLEYTKNLIKDSTSSPQLIVQLFAELASACWCFGIFGIEHFDLCSSNVVLCGGSLRVIDFGRARALVNESTDVEGHFYPDIVAFARFAKRVRMKSVEDLGKVWSLIEHVEQFLVDVRRRQILWIDILEALGVSSTQRAKMIVDMLAILGPKEEASFLGHCQQYGEAVAIARFVDKCDGVAHKLFFRASDMYDAYEQVALVMCVSKSPLDDIKDALILRSVGLRVTHIARYAAHLQCIDCVPDLAWWEQVSLSAERWGKQFLEVCSRLNDQYEEKWVNARHVDPSLVWNTAHALTRWRLYTTYRHLAHLGLLNTKSSLREFALAAFVYYSVDNTTGATAQYVFDLYKGLTWKYSPHHFFEWSLPDGWDRRNLVSFASLGTNHAMTTFTHAFEAGRPDHPTCDSCVIRKSEGIVCSRCQSASYCSTSCRDKHHGHFHHCRSRKMSSWES